MIKSLHRENLSQNLRDGERPLNKPVLAGVFIITTFTERWAGMNLHPRLRYYRLKFMRNVLNRCTGGRRGSQLDARFDNIYNRDQKEKKERYIG